MTKFAKIRNEYDPYGTTTQSSTTYTNPYQYTGRERDLSGLYYCRARYYRPQWGRFISEDPIGLAAGLNSYAYVQGNPISLVDPLGLQSRELEYEYRMSGATPPTVGDHYYNIWVPLCASGCSPTDAFNAMRNFSAPGAPYAQNGTHDHTLILNNPIRQTVDPCKQTITNQTLPGHQFGGSVTISVQQRNGVVGAQIVGTGVGPNPIMNQLMGPAIFEYLGYRAAGSLQGSGP
ncbi:RHS repeat-associated core domain-containing protein [Xanthomonas fragariae]|uniref:RHS repeat-associated core domain-containing protein n=1 Tax=Xanthomonas fragariae TaxID=48664 RepID=UPI003D18BF85